MFDVKQLGRVGILMGGYSSERDISLKSGKAVLKALQEEGLSCVPLDIRHQEIDKIKESIREARIDLAFITLHGKLGEDGIIQSILEQCDIPYTGSGVKASQIAINKIQTQKLLQENSIAIASCLTVHKGDGENVIQQIEKKLNYPVVVKPPCEGSSIGISLAKDNVSLQKALDTAWEYAPEILVEQYIKGRELTVGILADTALPIVEIIHQGGFFDFQAKYQSQTTQYIVPAPLTVCLAQEIRKTALQTHHILGCEDLSRIDFILGEDERYYVLEVNTIPGFTSSSLLPKAANETGIHFNQLCLKLIYCAYGKKKTNKNITINH